MIIADTGFWVALGNPKDDYHALALKTFSALNASLITTWPVMTEVCHLLLHRRGIAAQLKFVEMYRYGVFSVFDIDSDQADRLEALMQT